MKKAILVLFAGVFLYSCSQDLETTQAADASSKDSAAFNLSTHDNSNLGLYRGVFSTLDSSKRGTFDLEIKEGANSRASLTTVDGMEYKFSTSEIIEDNTNVINALFVGEGVSFQFSVDRDGSNPRFSEVIFQGSDAALKGLKETSRLAVTAQTGTWTCTTGCSGTNTWNLAFTVGDGTGDTADITTMIMLNGTDIGTSTGNTQSGCSDDGNITTCTLAGTTAFVPAAGDVISWTGDHRYNSDNNANCSEVDGTWSGGALSGTWATDASCFFPGNFPFTAIPITPTAEGTATNCLAPTFTVDISNYTNSGLTGDTTCSPTTTGSDIFYSWTATTDALAFRAEQFSGEANEDIIIRDAATFDFIACAEGSFFGGAILSGWSVGDELIIQVINNLFDATTGFCLAEASVPDVPGNDLCEDAFVISCGDTVTGNTLLATDSTNNDGPDVFYTFTGTVEGQAVTVSTCGSGYDTRIRIWEDCGGVEIIQNDDNSGACGPGGNSQLTFIASAGEDYIILIEGFSDDDFGPFELSIVCTDPAPTCGGTTTDFSGATGNVGNCPSGSDFVATSTATGTIGTDADIDNVSVVFIESAFSTPIVNIELTSPDGTTLELGNSIDGSNGINALFRDGGAVGNYQAPEVQPSGGNFADAFDGESINGNWTLTLCDESNTGSELTSWSIGFCDDNIPPPSAAPTAVGKEGDTGVDSYIEAARNREKLYAERKRRWIEDNNK